MCYSCSKPLYRRPDRLDVNKSFCLTCFRVFNSEMAKLKNQKEYDQYIEKWKQGSVSGMSGSTGLSGHIRKYIFLKYSSKCIRCGWCEIHPITKKIPLEVNHIDGDYTNNKEENLELICPNCHSLTVSYRSLNIGKGRKRK